MYLVLIVKNKISREKTNHCKEITLCAKIHFDFTTEIHRATDFLIKKNLNA